MFERYLADALATHFGHIIDNLDHNNIAVSAWRGGLILTNVNLRKSALDNILHSPLEIGYGKVGTLKVKIPWKLVRGFLFRGSSASSDLSISLELSDVDILVLPKGENSGTEAPPQHEQDAIREKLVAGVLEANLIQRLSTAKTTDSSKNFLSNLSITVRNIHIRYEDTGDCLGFRKNDEIQYRPPFAIGLMLKEFSLSNGTLSSTKIASAVDLAVYWDSDVAVMSSHHDEGIFADCFAKMGQVNHEFLLDPLSASVALNFTCKGSHGTIALELPSCRFSLYKSLLEDGGYLRKSISLWKNEMMGLGGETLSRLASLRPPERPNANPTGWWHFVVSAVIAVNADKKRHERNAKFDPDSEVSYRAKGWVGFVKAYHRRKLYCQLFRAFVGASPEYRKTLHDELIVMERDLLVEEIAAFRMHFFERYDLCDNAEITHLVVPTMPDSEQDVGDELADDTEQQLIFSSELNAEQRLRYFVQVVTTLKEQHDAAVAPVHSNSSSGFRDKAIMWKTSLQCLEFSIQVHDSHQRAWSPHSLAEYVSSPVPSSPVMRLSCAFAQEQELLRDGSWRLSSQVGSLVVNDCSADENHRGQRNLLGPKSLGRIEWNEEDTFKLNGRTFQKSIWVRIDRTKTFGSDGLPLGSSTRTLARVLPLEFVYLSRPIEALSHIGETFNDDFAEDYHRLSHSLINWREKQKQRLLMALAHKHKKLYIDVVIGAPLVLIPEDGISGGQVLVVDLGQLRFFDDTSLGDCSAQFDDKWKLQIKSIQVQRLIGAHIFQQIPESTMQIIEPFSLDFALWTRVSDDAKDDSSALIQATLPRLKINVTSSAVQMLRVLQDQWESLRQARKVSPIAITSNQSDEVPNFADKVGKRSLEVQFNAPLLDVHLEHDLEGQSVFDLSLKGISGRFEQSKGRDFKSNHFAAKVHTLVVVDTFGSSKHDNNLLISSVPTNISSPGSSSDAKFFDATSQNADLVYFEYDSRRSLRSRRDDELDGADKLSVRFHELFVNWNPECISLIMRALCGNPNMRSTPAEETFFDAVEDKFYDAIDPARPSSPSRSVLSDLLDQSAFEVETKGQNLKMLEVVFTMSKLRVDFNRDDRNRQVLSAEMIQTSVRYSTMSNGGSRTFFTIGNLILSDLSSLSTGTLYRDIMGLKTSGDGASLVSVELIVNPKARQYVSLMGTSDDPLVELGKPLSIDEKCGRVHGFDYYLNARFSPMRFVYIQQVWFEIIDYFFAGIIGNEVWGGTASFADYSVLEGPSIDADSVSFTRFDVSMENPDILIPVHSCSPDYLQLDISRVSLRNRYTYDSMRPADLTFRDGGNRQWYNNCSVELHRIRCINGATRSTLNLEDRTPTVQVHLNWPIGPSAVVNVPKWQVTCDVDDLHLRFDRGDYALFQNIITYNIGENSRHMKEWEHYLSLDRSDREKYVNKSAVHFGYDEKDATPSTFTFDVDLKDAKFNFVDSCGLNLATLKTNRLQWKYKRLDVNRTSHQTISCDPRLTDSDGKAILYIDAGRYGSGQPSHGFVYQSFTNQSGFNSKMITAFSPTFLFPSSTWLALVEFFGDVVVPAYLDPGEAIQVGDRWYRIGDSSMYDVVGSFQSIGPIRGDSQPADYNLEIKLIAPMINIGSDSKILLSSHTASYRYIRSAGRFGQNVLLSGVFLGSVEDPVFKPHVKASGVDELELEMKPELDSYLNLAVSDAEIVLSPLLIDCLLELVPSSMLENSPVHLEQTLEPTEWDVDSETRTEATANSWESMENAACQGTDISIHQLQIRVVAKEGVGESIDACSLGFADVAMSRKLLLLPGDAQTILSQTILLSIQSVDFFYQPQGRRLLSIHPFRLNSSSIEICFNERNDERKQRFEFSFAKVLIDLNFPKLHRLINMVTCHFSRFLEWFTTKSETQQVALALRSIHASFLELSLSVYFDNSEKPVLGLSFRQCSFNKIDHHHSATLLDLSVRDWFLFDCSSNIIRRTENQASSNDSSEAIVLNFGAFPNKIGSFFRRFPSWVESEIQDRGEGAFSVVSLKMASLVVSFVPENLSAIKKLSEEWSSCRGETSRRSTKSHNSYPTLLVDVYLSNTALALCSDRKQGIVLSFDALNAKRSHIGVSMQVDALTSRAFTSGNQQDILSPIMVTIRGLECETEDKVMVSVQESLVFSLTLEHLVILSDLRASFPRGLIQEETRKPAGNGKITNVCCGVESFCLTMSENANCSEILQLLAKRIDVTVEVAAEYVTIEAVLGSLGILDVGSTFQVQQKDMLPTVIVGSQFQDLMDEHQSSPNPEVSVKALLGEKREIAVVMNRLRFAVLPGQLENIFRKLLSVPLLGPRATTMHPQNPVELDIRITCNRSQFVYAPESLDSALGIAVNLSFVARVGEEIDRANNRNRSLSLHVQDAVALMIPDVSNILLKHPHGIAQPSDAPSRRLLEPLAFSFEFSQSSNQGINYVFTAEVDPIVIMTSISDLLLLQELCNSFNLSQHITVFDRDGQGFRTFNVLFHSEKLGIALRRQQMKIEVENINDRNDNDIQKGDCIYAINGEIVFDNPDETVTSIADRLNSKTRPILITFCRSVSEDSSGVRNSQRVAIVVDLSMTGVTIFISEKDMPLFCCRSTDATVQFTRDIFLEGEANQCDVTSLLSLDYYNLRVWNWEPLLDPCNFFVAVSHRSDPLRGEDIAIEAGDRESCFEFTSSDAFFETLHRATQRLNRQPTVANEPLFYDVADVQQKVEQLLESIADKQIRRSQRHFVFKNRSGISLAFARSTPNKTHGETDKNNDLCAIGGYLGMNMYDASQVSIVGSGEDLPFSLALEESSSTKDCVCACLGLTVALQEINGVSCQPFQNLQLVRSNEVALALNIPGANEDSNKEWVTWSVDHVDESCVITMGTSLRITSLIHNRLEIGVRCGSIEVDESGLLDIKRLAHVSLGSSYDLPLWLPLRRVDWHCYVRLNGSSPFNLLFSVSSRGKVTLRGSTDGKVECKGANASSQSYWLAVCREDFNGICSIVVDSSISIRNLLPVPIDWEVKENQSNPFDGSIHRSSTLQTGCFADVLCRHSDSMLLRFRPSSQDLRWSDWTPLNAHSSRRSEAQNEAPVDEYDLKLTIHDYLQTLTIGARVCRKDNGLDVVLYSDLWCLNCTRFDLVFGCQARVSTLGANEHLDQVLNSANEIVSTAEATLKEISSLFEAGAAAPALRRPESVDQDSSTYTFRLPDQRSCTIVEETFEYVETENRNIKRRWWATENPLRACKSLAKIDEHSTKWHWIDESWLVDMHGDTYEGWETSSNLTDFVASRQFNPEHRYRRRRWHRKRSSASNARCLDDVNAYCCIHPSIRRRKTREGEVFDASIAIQLNGGRWSLLPIIPTTGTAYGVLRTQGNRWPSTTSLSSDDNKLHELCYSISPVEGEFGLFTRALVVSSRFLIRNDSTGISFLVKPASTDDSFAVCVKPGEVIPFHWGTDVSDERFCVRPVADTMEYQWSRGIDPLSIGNVPVRALPLTPPDLELIRSIHVEIDIRAGSGGTGINISLKEENNEGNGSLFRIENATPMPVWIVQDVKLAGQHRLCIDFEDCVDPSQQIAFGLTHPSIFQKRAQLDSSSLSDRLIAKISLCPLSSALGLDLAETITLDARKDDEKIVLFPTLIPFLPSVVRKSLEQSAIVGTMSSDGPTRVLSLRLLNGGTGLKRRWAHRRRLSESPVGITDVILEKIIRGAESITACLESEPVSDTVHCLPKRNETSGELRLNKNKSISLRASFSCLRVSFVDSSPAEILVLTMDNFNALASWDQLRLSDSTVYITLSDLQVDNMVPNAPFPVALSRLNSQSSVDRERKSPLLVVGFSIAPRHSSGVVCFRSITLLPRDIAIKLDIATLVRIQKYLLDIKLRFDADQDTVEGRLPLPQLSTLVKNVEAAASSDVGSQKFYFGFLTILPLCIRLSVSSPRALSQAHASLLGPEIAAIHQAVRKGDILLGKRTEGLVGVKIGSKNKTPIMVIQGMLKSFLLDGLLRLDGASLTFSGLTLESHTATLSQMGTSLIAHYLAGMRKNLPALVGSMAAFGNPLGLVRGLGEGVGDFVLEPARGFQRSVQEMDASHLVDGVARGTLSLARHTVGGFADSAAMLAETFSKNMTVLTLDRRYALKRDRGDPFRCKDDINVADGIGSGAQKLARGFLDGVAGVVKAPIRGAEKRGLEGFAKGVGKGLLGLLVKPIIGISDGFTDVMIGVKGTLDGASGHSSHSTHVRPGRAFYGHERSLRPYSFGDAAASALMLQTRLAGEHYLSFIDMGNRVALLSVKRLVILGHQGQELLVLKLKHIASVTTRNVGGEAVASWGVIVLLNTPRRNGSEVEVILCQKDHASDLARKLDEGRMVAAFDTV